MRREVTSYMQHDFINKAYLRFNRNRLDQHGNAFKKNRVNLIYWQKRINLGDTLAPVIFEWMLKRKGVLQRLETKRTYALATIGSIVDLGRFDAVIWGSGLQSFESLKNIARARYRKLDVRAVRGPLTRQALMSCGQRCPEVYGDPGILMPYIYSPTNVVKKDKIILINHYTAKDLPMVTCGNPLDILDIETADYQPFIDTLCSAKKVISSSLHGIILAESYGIPSVFLLRDTSNKEILKYYDWYFSTNRYSVKTALSIEEALSMKPMQLPENLEEMREKLIQQFPYDLWEKG